MPVLLLEALFAAGVAVLLLLGPLPARAASPQDCEALASTDFSRIPDAPTRVVAAQTTNASGSVPTFCRVEGYIAPQVGFEFRFPLENWNGKFLMQGCGAFCGSLQGLESCPEALARGFACGTTDMGHRAPAMDGKWAYDNPQAKIDAGYRATHVATLAGKALLRALYKQDAARSYFRGCSTGGRQGLVEAQRYPYDFDGVISGAPVLYTPMGPPLQSLWNSTANLDASGAMILSAAKLEWYAGAVMKACDAVDGLKDGLISDPRACKFDPATLACQGTTSGECLSPAELGVVRKFYDGPRNSKGRFLRVGGQMPGSERSWSIYLKGKETLFYGFFAENLRYLGFPLDPGPTYDATQFDWDRDPQRLSYSLLTAGNPDLGLFAENGGKLILFHGWSDPAISATSTIGYYEMVTRTMGGLARTQDFARLYLLPGLGHCTGGGVNFVDFLSALDAWVESGKAPDLLVGYGFAGPVGPAVAPAEFNGRNLSTLPSTLARPLFPYPDTPKYRSGEANDPGSFARVRAAAANVSP
jgi:feruloyl esterase